MDKRIRTPLGTMWLSELLISIAGIWIVIGMLVYASTMTQYVVAGIAVISGLYGIYDLSRPSQGSYSFTGLLGLGSLIVTVLMMVVYATTLFST